MRISLRRRALRGGAAKPCQSHGKGDSPQHADRIHESKPRIPIFRFAQAGPMFSFGCWFVSPAALGLREAGQVFRRIDVRHHALVVDLQARDEIGPAAQHLIRYNKFKDAPDFYINSFYNAEKNEVAAFEELIGCHGGMGGYQTRPFVLYPSEWKLEGDHLVGAPAVYQQFKLWLAQLQGLTGTENMVS